MSWEMLNSLIEQAGQCQSALSDIGGDISNLGGEDNPVDIKITATDDGATITIETIAKTADEKTAKRTIEIGAETIKGEFDTVTDEAGHVVDKNFKFHYGAELDRTWTDQLSTVIQDAEDATHLIDLKFKYGADGELESTSVKNVQQAADDVTKETTYLFNYGANEKLETATVTAVQTAANDVTNETRYFQYGANGQLEKASVDKVHEAAGQVIDGVHYDFEYGANGDAILTSKSTIQGYADGVIDKQTRTFYYDADGKLVKEILQNDILPYANSIAAKESDRRTFYYTADGQRLLGEIETIEADANGVVQRVTNTTFTYNAQWEPNGYTYQSVETDANGVATVYIVTFDGDGNEVSKTVTTLTGEVDGLVNSPVANRTIVFQADGSKVISTIGDIEKSIADVQAKAKEAAPTFDAGLSAGEENGEENGEVYGPYITRDANGNIIHTDAEGNPLPLPNNDYVYDPETGLYLRDGIYPQETRIDPVGTFSEAANDLNRAMALFPSFLKLVENTAWDQFWNNTHDDLLPYPWAEAVSDSKTTNDLKVAADALPFIVSKFGDLLGAGSVSVLSWLFGNDGVAGPWLNGLVTASEPSWVSEDKQDDIKATEAEQAQETADGVGEAVTDAISTWWGSLTTAKEPSWLNVDVDASDGAKEVAEFVGKDGKTVKIGVDAVEKGNTDEVVQAFTGEDKDNAVITKELEVEVSDDTQELLDGFYGLCAGDDEISMSFDVSTNEDGIKILKLIESYGNDDGLQVVTTFKVDEDGLIQIKEIQKIGDEISGEKQMTVTADTAEANSSISKLLNRLNQLKNKNVTISATVKGSAGTAVSNVGVSSGSVFDRISSWLTGANAKGTKHFGGGLSLINEEGPELITADGWARILANGKPTIANIPKGATIYTASETAQILGGAKQSVFPAFATGYLDNWSKALAQLKNDPVKAVTNGVKAVGEAVGEFLSGVIKGNTGVGGTVKIPEKKEEEKKDDTKKTTTSGGSAKKDEAEFWDVIQKYIEYGLKKIQYQIDERQEAITALERERDKLMKPIDKELDELNWQIEEAEYRVKLIQRNRDDATKALKEQIDALKEAREIEEDEEQLEEKRLAVIEAQNALKDAQYDRTVRYYNEATGQWEWMADQSAVKNAEDALKDAEKAYEDALKDYEITQLERQVKAIEKMYDAQAKPYEDELEQYNRQVEDLQYQRNQIERQYASSIDPLQEAMDEIQQTYDDLDKYYNKVQDAIAVPMDDLEAALTAMQGAEANYANQFDNVQSLLDTLYDLAPTWDAISVGALGMSAASGAISNTNFADVLNNNGQTIIINGLSVEGDGTMSLNELIAKAGIYRNYNE